MLTFLIQYIALVSIFTLPISPLNPNKLGMQLLCWGQGANLAPNSPTLNPRLCRVNIPKNSLSKIDKLAYKMVQCSGAKRGMAVDWSTFGNPSQGQETSSLWPKKIRKFSNTRDKEPWWCQRQQGGIKIVKQRGHFSINRQLHFDMTQYFLTVQELLLRLHMWPKMLFFWNFVCWK